MDESVTAERIQEEWGDGTNKNIEDFGAPLSTFESSL
jgi:hypothetical protein